MSAGWFALVEMLLVFGGVLGWAIYQIRSVSRASEEDAKRPKRNDDEASL